MPTCPRLGRVDGEPVSKDTLSSRRFSIAIQSVHYFLEAGEIGCAVVVRTTFDLQKNDKLAYALVPLTARPSYDRSLDSENVQIEISEHFPASCEYIQVMRCAGTKQIVMLPKVGVNVLGSGAEFGGIGIKKSQDDSVSHTISLHPVRRVLAGHPTYLDWKFEDPSGIFYPPSVDLLIVVTKQQDQSGNQTWFLFELRLEWQLKVEVHGINWKGVTRLVERVNKHDGWCFKVEGNYKAELARQALEVARAQLQGRKEGESLTVGLEPAVGPWLKAKLEQVSAQPVSDSFSSKSVCN
ncbi:hypothetical protein C8J56DRAFT_589061 [Mycena floridula]|nr:hypothetical protein C8J56DRAFT_589061 [Mycena floridula]